MRYIPFVVVALSLAGCTTLHPPGDGPRIGTKTSIPIAQPAGDRVFTVPKTTSHGTAVVAGEVRAALVRHIAHDRSMPNDAQFSIRPDTKVLRASWEWAAGLNFNLVHVEFPITVDASGAQLKVTLHCPQELSSHKMDLSITGIQHWDHEKIGRSATQACANARISMVETITGDVNTDFNDSSVFANFSRRLTPVSKQRWSAYVKEVPVTKIDIKKAQLFFVPAPQGETIASISVFPYRDGSKVVYAFDYRYDFTGGTESTYKTSDIAVVKSVIEKIAND